jgi:GDPmannose 4,6-dehydratase
VVATGETHSVREFVELAFNFLDLDWHKHVKIDPRYFRPTEVDLLHGDSTKARRLLGWQPTVSFRQLVTLMVEADWQVARRERLVKENSSLIATGNRTP